MGGQIFIDADALAHSITPVSYQVGVLKTTTVILKSVGSDITRISNSPDPEKREAGRRAALTIARLQSMLNVKISMDRQKPTANHTDDDLLNRAQRARGCILTADTELQGRARAAGIRVITVQDLKRCFEGVSEEIAAIFPQKCVLSQGDILSMRIDKLGREDSEGIGFLNDGRMVVVQNGKSYLGADVEVLVEYVSKSSTGIETIFASV